MMYINYIYIITISFELISQIAHPNSWDSWIV